MSWFVRNVSDMEWWDRGPRGFVTDLVGDDEAQVGPARQPGEFREDWLP